MTFSEEPSLSSNLELYSNSIPGFPNITTARELTDSEENRDANKFFEQALEDVERTKYMPERDYAATKFLQNVTDDLALAKFEIDKNGNQAVSKLLQQALDDVAVSKYLNDLSKFTIEAKQKNQAIEEQRDDIENEA